MNESGKIVLTSCSIYC